MILLIIDFKNFKKVLSNIKQYDNIIYKGQYDFKQSFKMKGYKCNTV